MTSYEDGVFTGAILAFMVMLIVLYGCISFTNSLWEKEAIAVKAAHYHPKTSEFTWNFQPGGETNECIY